MIECMKIKKKMGLKDSVSFESILDLVNRQTIVTSIIASVGAVVINGSLKGLWKNVTKINEYDKKLYKDKYEKYSYISDYSIFVTKNSLKDILIDCFYIIFSKDILKIKRMLKKDIWRGHDYNIENHHKLKEFNDALKKENFVSSKLNKKRERLCFSIDKLMCILNNKDFYEFNEEPEWTPTGFGLDGIPTDHEEDYYYTYMPSRLNLFNKITEKESLKRCKIVYKSQQEFYSCFNDFNDYAKKRLY